MTSPPLPDNWQELMAGYVLADLSPEETEAFQQLLTDHPDLVQEVNQLHETLSVMPYALPQQAPPPQLRQRILQSAEESPPSQQWVTPRRQSQRRYPVWFGVSGAIAASTIVGLGIYAYQLQQQLNRANAIIAEFQRPTTLIYTLNSPDQATSASARLILSPAQPHATVVAQNLPPLHQGTVYRLWAMPADGTNPVYCGDFTGDRNGTVSTQVTLPESICSAQPTQLLVTTERATDPPVPKGELILQSKANAL